MYQTRGVTVSNPNLKVGTSGKIDDVWNTLVLVL